MNTLITSHSKVIDINHVKTKEERLQSQKNLVSFYQRQDKIRKIQKQLHYGK